MVTDDAMQIIDGVMLSDGSIKRPAAPWFEMSQAGEEHTDWLKLVSTAFASLGVRVSELKVHKGRDWWYIYTLEHSMVAALYKRWYPHGVKVVPDDFILTPVSLAHWFMGDGSTGWLSRTGLSAIFLCTEGFDLDSAHRLLVALEGLGIAARPNVKKWRTGQGVRIAVSRAASVRYFLGLIKPYIVPSYEYKIKVPREPKHRIGFHVWST